MSKDVPGDMAKNVPADVPKERPADVPKDLPADVPGDGPAAGSEAARHDASRGYGFELPLLLFGGFRSIIDDLHAELARRGHPDMRPAHGFALQAIGLAGATATEAGRRLGISKQAAGKTIERLEELGYVHRAGDETDRR